MLATDLLADYAAGDPQVLTDLLMDADEKQFARIYPILNAQAVRGFSSLTDELDKEIIVLPPMTWNVRFHSWQRVGPMEPPADWEAVLTSPILEELQMSPLSFHRAHGLPTKRVPTDHFAVVATTEVVLSKGEYGFTIRFDDGVRLWVDNKIVFENWNFNHQTVKSVVVVLESGKHAIKVEYFQIDGGYALDVRLIIPDDSKEKLAKRQANAAVALLRMNQPEKVWLLLKHSPDPRLRSYLIHRFGPLGGGGRSYRQTVAGGTRHHDTAGVDPQPGRVHRGATRARAKESGDREAAGRLSLSR
jgi:hypothetical protein